MRPSDENLTYRGRIAAPSWYVPARGRQELNGNHIEIGALLWTGDFTVLAEAIAAWLGEEPRVGVGISGEELWYEDENIELYCYPSGRSSPEDEKPCFLLNGKMSASLDAAKSKLRALAVCCRDRGFDAVLYCTEVDEDWNRVSEEFEVKLDPLP